MKTTYRSLRAIATGVLLLLSVSLAVAQEDKLPRTTKETVRGTVTSSIETLQGTVEYVEGNHLVVRMANGEIREFDPPADRKFIIDGKELAVRNLKPGTKLKASVVTTSTSITDRTKTVGTAKVFWVNGNNLILTLPNGENRTYKVKDDYKFIVEGQTVRVSDLKKGMQISAEKIVEEPKTEIASKTTVTGQAPTSGSR
jgi:hypothetical protein